MHRARFLPAVLRASKGCTAVMLRWGQGSRQGGLVRSLAGHAAVLPCSQTSVRSCAQHLGDDVLRPMGDCSTGQGTEQQQPQARQGWLTAAFDGTKTVSSMVTAAVAPLTCIQSGWHQALGHSWHQACVHRQLITDPHACQGQSLHP